MSDKVSNIYWLIKKHNHYERAGHLHLEKLHINVRTKTILTQW